MKLTSLTAFYLFYTRQGHSNAVWFLGVRKPEDDTKILDSMRGLFHEDQWHPTKDEHQHCCDEYETKVTNAAPYGLIEHCTTREHIEAIVATLTPDQCLDIISTVRTKKLKTSDELYYA